MTEAITQGILALTLLFGVATILPKTRAQFKRGNRGRGFMYVLMALVCSFFLVLSAAYAIDSFNIWRASN